MRLLAKGLSALVVVLYFQTHSQAQYFSPAELVTTVAERGEWADLDGDNLDDCIYLSEGSLFYVLNDYPNGFLEPVIFHSDLSIERFEIWDQDKDGSNDVFYFTSSELYLLENDGSLNWSPASFQGPLFSNDTQLDFLNNDSKVDIWRQYSSGYSNRIERKLLNGDGTYDTPSNLNLPYEINPWDVFIYGAAVAVDMNSDGYTDFYYTFAECAPLTSCTGTMTITRRVYINEGDAFFSTTDLNVMTTNSFYNVIEVIDLDMDGIKDDMITSGLNASTRISRGGENVFSLETIDFNFSEEMGTCGDLDGDGINDVFYTNYWDSSVLKLVLSSLSDGDSFEFSLSDYFEPQHADLDGNGVDELLGYDTENGNYYSYSALVYGCIDDTACNYNPDMLVDDGSCNYVPGCGDLNGDSETDATDLLLFLSYFGCTLDCEGDMNTDSVVNTTDLLIFIALY